LLEIAIGLVDELLAESAVAGSQKVAHAIEVLLAAQFARMRHESREQLLCHIAHPAQLAGLVVEQLRVQSLARGSPAVLIEDLRGRVACLDALAPALGEVLDERNDECGN